MIALNSVQNIVVFRALMLGDWLCATPALRALRAAAPQAHITVCGLPWSAALMARLPYVDEFVEFPGHPQLPERRASAAELERFSATMRERQFDLALQMHGSGSVVNPLIASWGARYCAGGFDSPECAAGLDLAMPWVEDGSHEIQRWLKLVAALGAETQDTSIDFPLTADDHAEAARVLAQAQVQGGYAIVHPGSQLPSRRWSPQRFARVAEALSDQGLTVVVTGTAAEAPLAEAVCAAARCDIVDLSGKTHSLWTLGALVESAAIVVANDTGISHIAAALRTPSTIVASGSDVQRWAPLDKTRHRVLWHDVPCRPCAHAVCPTAHECAQGVSAEAVIDSVRGQLLLHRIPSPQPLSRGERGFKAPSLIPSPSRGGSFLVPSPSRGGLGWGWATSLPQAQSNNEEHAEAHPHPMHSHALAGACCCDGAKQCFANSHLRPLEGEGVKSPSPPGRRVGVRESSVTPM